MEPLILKALDAKRESRSIEFKESFDPDSTRECCEIVKDLVALANSGGGVIVFGIDNDGQPSEADLSPLTALDPARIGDLVRKYVEVPFGDFEIRHAVKGEHEVVAWLIGAAHTPMVFAKPGTYPDGKGQRAAFGQGTVYFRHGAKSEPGTTDDLARALDRRVEQIRREWIAGVRKVVKAPAGSVVNVLPQDIRDTGAPDATAIRITEDPAAPAYRVINPDISHPFRQKELIQEVKRRLPKGIEFNSFDVYALRRVHSIDGKADLCHQPKFGSRQYSEKLAEWIQGQHKADPDFFQKARLALAKP